MPKRPPFEKTKDGFSYKRGPWVPVSALLMVPFLLVLKLLHQFAGPDVNWKAAWGTVFLFEAVLLPIEWYHLSRGHWVYNESRIFGPKIFGVPIEEPLLYYLFSPLVIICIYHAVRQQLNKRRSE